MYDDFEGDILGIVSVPESKVLDRPLLQKVQAIGDEFLKRHQEKENRLELLKESLRREEEELAAIESNLELISQVRIVLQKLSETTRTQILAGLESVVRTYIQAIFGESFDFEATPRIYRSNMVIDFFVIDRTNPDAVIRMVPEGNMGGGLLDTVAIGLHYALIDMLPEKLVGPIFFDEPAKMASNDLIYSIGQLIKESQRIFGVQVIMITHHEQLQEIFDHTILLKKEKGVAQVVKQ